MKSTNTRLGYLLAILSAVIFSFSIPLSDWFLRNSISPLYLTAFLYLGVGMGMSLHYHFQKIEASVMLRKKDIQLFIAMGVLDTFAPIFFFSGFYLLQGTSAGILANTEFIFTLMFAFFIFRERFSFYSWLGILFVSLSVFLLNLQWENSNVSFSWDIGEWFILIGTLLWGIENNLSRVLSVGNPYRLLMIKGFSTFIGVSMITLIIQPPLPSIMWILTILFVGYIVYGLSLVAYVLSQRHLGAGMTQSIQSFAFILGSLLTYIVFQEALPFLYGLSLFIVLIALGLFGYENYRKKA